MFKYTSYTARAAGRGWQVLGHQPDGTRDILATRNTKAEARELTARLTATRAQLLEHYTRHLSPAAMAKE